MSAGSTGLISAAIAASPSGFTPRGLEPLTLEPHLADFVGLAGLEEDGDRSAVGQVMRFPDNRAAFDYAADCLRGILPDINV